MDFELHDRVVLVTGGSSGIGRATAIAFSREQARVAVTYRAIADGAEATVRTITDAGGQRTVTERWGGVDVLVNNAAETGRHAEAFNPASPGFADIAPEQWQPQLVTGLEGVVHTVQAALEAMRGRGWGRIAFVSSAAAEHGGPKEQAYAATKAALAGLTTSLAREFGPAGILVNIVMPALTLTDRVRRTVPEPVQKMIAGHLASGKLSTPDDVANAIVFLCSAANGNITGETLRVTGGI